MAPPTPSVAFICTGNACRSQMAEALLRHEAGDAFSALSAGTRPAGFVHPLAMRTLERMGVSTAGLESKHVEDILTRPLDVVITVCDNASAECPAGLGRLANVHWGFPDPVFHQGSEKEREEFCAEVAARIHERIKELARLQFDRLSPSAIQERLSSLAPT